MPDNEFDPARNEAEFHAGQAEMINLAVEAFRRRQQLSTELEIAKLDGQLAASKLDIEQQLAKARLDLAQSMIALTRTSIELYKAFHPSELPSPLPPI